MITLCLLLKAPVLGAVKTRVAATLGEAEALHCHRRLAEYQLTQVPDEWHLEVHFTPAAELASVRAWLGARPDTYVPQADGDLGLRMASAQAAAFKAGGTRVLIIGGDCPQLDSATLLNAAARLHEHEVVIVPATDGGYALIGTAKPTPRLFEEVDWSTARVFPQTLERIQAAGLSVAVMPTVSDVDTGEDWIRAKHLFAG